MFFQMVWHSVLVKNFAWDVQVQPRKGGLHFAMKQVESVQSVVLWEADLFLR